MTRDATPARELPEPYSDELKSALRRRNVGNLVHQYIYAYLYQRRYDPPTDREIAEFVYEKTGSRYSQLQRRRRDLNSVFDIVRTSGHRYILSGWLDEELAEATGISRSVRFKILQSGRCKNCGRSVEADEIKLAVDHILPQAWGGSDAEENLQALCEDCNAGKKDYYGQFDEFADQIRRAAGYREPHRRIAMLLKAFDGHFVMSELLAAVASAQQFQDDWQKRMRELRELGIDFESRRHRSSSGRMIVEWRLTRWTELPEEPLRPLISRRERERRKRGSG
ncbi:MAG: HNH endonuclease signature motif containing protein [Brachybacterium sp.]|nr:HNH endonuclease signature motif containing protein [Brachybacterium sp.]